MKPPKLTSFGTKAFPVWLSRMDDLLRCPLSVASRVWGWHLNEGSVAADTGIAVGKVLEMWHSGREFQDVLDQLSVDLHEDYCRFPLAKEDDVKRVCAAYVADERNARNVVQSVEENVEGKIANVYFKGRYDQVRDGAVWDLKNGRPWGSEMVRDYLCQLTAYAEFGGFEMGGIIRLQDYVQKEPGRVFYPISLGSKARQALLLQVVEAVKEIRKGLFIARPGKACGWCGFGGPEFCLEFAAKARGL